MAKNWANEKDVLDELSEILKIRLNSLNEAINILKTNNLALVHVKDQGEEKFDVMPAGLPPDNSEEVVVETLDQLSAKNFKFALWLAGAFLLPMIFILFGKYFFESGSWEIKFISSLSVLIFVFSFYNAFKNCPEYHI